MSKALDKSMNNPTVDSRLSIEEEILSYNKAITIDEWAVILTEIVQN